MDPLYSATRFDDDETPDHQHVPDAVVYVATRGGSPFSGTPTSLCSYHRHFRSRTGSGNDAMWRGPDGTPPIYAASAAAGNAGARQTTTSFPLLVHPASTLAMPYFRSPETRSPEVVRRPPPTSFRSADNLDCTVATHSPAGRRDYSSTPPRQPVAADLVEAIRRKRPVWTASGHDERSETENLCSCEQSTTAS